MAKQKVLKILVSKAVTAGEQEDAKHIDLWKMIDQVRHTQDPSLDVKLQSQHSSDDVMLKSGDADAILVLVTLATFTARPALRFIVDLAKILVVDWPQAMGARRRKKLKIKTKTAEIEFEGEDIEELRSIARYACDERLEETSLSSPLPEVQKPDMELIIEYVEDTRK